MTEIEIQPRGTKERIVIRRDPSPAVSINSDTATVGGQGKRSNTTKTIIIVPDKDRPRRERVVITRSDSPSSDRADAGKGDRWPPTRDVIRSRTQSIRSSESASQGRTRTQSLSIDLTTRRSGSRRRSKDTEAWIKEQSETSQTSKDDSQKQQKQQKQQTQQKQKKPENQVAIQRGFQRWAWDSSGTPVPVGWQARFNQPQPPGMYFFDHRLAWNDPRLQHRIP